MSAIDTNNLKVNYGETTVVSDLSLSLLRGEVTALIGPNGSGKSTILRTIARLLQPDQGAIYLDGCNIAKLKTKEIARQLAFLPQSQEVPAGVKVRELIGYGRYPYQGLLRGFSQEDSAAIRFS